MCHPIVVRLSLPRKKSIKAVSCESRSDLKASSITLLFSVEDDDLLDQESGRVRPRKSNKSPDDIYDVKLTDESLNNPSNAQLHLPKGDLQAVGAVVIPELPAIETLYAVEQTHYFSVKKL